MSFSDRANSIIDDTLKAVQQAEEIGGVESLEEYARVMLRLSDIFQDRAQIALDRLKYFNIDETVNWEAHNE